MKQTLLILIAISSLMFVTGCKPSNRVVFKPALVSIDPGAGWKALPIPADPPVCSPRLVGKPGMINALLLEIEGDDVKRTVDSMQASLTTTSKAVPNSFKQEEFTTDSGLAGIHLSYTAKAVPGSSPEKHSHSFVTRNGSRKCISISYITSPEAESAAVLEAIRKTLRVE